MNTHWYTNRKIMEAMQNARNKNTQTQRSLKANKCAGVEKFYGIYIYV